ncbi:exodeoxyribonuclease V subunit beta [Luteimonas vadosa]|uniref:RecBCD enzyme subunit RecB n=1 Tax=Luteimonas vadosa TaxID=1165507 RepID=A0ABP9DSR9_9GAMM
MSAPVARDPWLDLPLSGTQLIEASAGTGKTFTLATLVTRLVVERDLRIGQVLAVTYTEAATQELRKRIRERLQLAHDLVGTPAADGEPPAATLTRQLLQAHRDRRGESDDALRRRLRQALLDIDLAAIFTIHGFCARVLREHALESGQGFDPPELLANDRDLREALAADLWRSHAIDDAAVDDLAALWPGGHAALAADLRDLLREPVLLPPDVPLPPEPVAQVRAAAEALAQAFRAHGDDFRAALLAALDAKVLNAGSYRAEWIEPLFAEAAAWCAGTLDTPFEHAKLPNLRRETLLDKTNAKGAGLTPDSPLCDALAGYLDALAALSAWKHARRAALLHRIRDEAHARLALLKQQRRVQTYDDMIDGVADALDGDHGDALAERLRVQYRVALVDEFQDTDARQWRIFARVFGADVRGEADAAEAADGVHAIGALAKAHADDTDTRFLALIGDPKQAIYGFRGGDVHAYLAAGDRAGKAPPLAHNFRSRPSVLAAIDALYVRAQAAFEDEGNKQVDAPPFVDPRIRFHPVEAGGKRGDDDFLRDGEPAPALTVWRAPPTGEFDKKGDPKNWSAPESRALATRACVAAIHGVLSDARAGRATLKDGDALRPVQPGDIAVLVRSHHEATLVQRALALAGIPAVAAGKLSLFATEEARELHALLLALLHAGDDGRLRAALSTVLVGVDAAGIEALEHPAEGASVDAHRHWQAQALAWRERLLRGGPLALAGDLCAAGSERLLGLLDGERRVSNYLQLAELLQEAQAGALGLHGLVDWLGHRIATADADDETQQLRLESDARRVQIVTLHKAKGLEYPLVFLPFVGIGRQDKSPAGYCIAHDAAHGRRLHWKLDLPEAEWDAAKEAWKTEQRAEDARLLYVGLTRAEHALWIASGDFYLHGNTPLAGMLQDPRTLAATPGLVFDDALPPEVLPRLPPESDAAIPPARTATRRLSHDWWVHSFSQLARADAGDATAASTLPAPGGHDEPDAAEDAPVEADFDPRFAGNRYGVALHGALEHMALQDVASGRDKHVQPGFAAWRDWQPGNAAPAGHDLVIAEALRAEGYGADVVDDGVALTTQFIGQTLTVPLPEGTRLCDLPFEERRPEIEFQFALQPLQVDALLQLLHAHGVVRDRHGFGLRQRLEGLMTGLIDLTYRHDGRWYVLDYKSNRLPGYDTAALQRAMAHSEYDLQALIYTLALHRWLRFRLGDSYDYARDFGGIRYVFCRGLDATRDDSPGIHAQRFSPELVHALDALFGATDPGRVPARAHESLPPPLAGEGGGGGAP